MQDKQPVRWGIWSTGNIAGKFARDLKSVSDAVLHSVRSRSLSEAVAFGKAHGLNVAAYDNATFLNDPDLDVIYIASPHKFHCEQALEAIAAGKPVLIEKPIAMNSNEVARIEAASTKHGIFAMEATWTRFLPTTQRAREMLNSGVLGKPVRAEATLHFFCRYDPNHRLFNPSLGGGAMLDLGIYPLSIAQFLLGDLKLKDARWAAAPSGVDHNARFEFTAGQTPVEAAVGFWETRQEQGDNRFIIYCEKGALALDRPFVAAPRLMVWNKPIKQLPLVEGNKLQREWAKYRARNATIFAPERQTTGLNFQVEAVHAALRAGKTQIDDMPRTASASVLKIIEEVVSRPPSAGPYR
ncbi:MAG: Gfo/Idh/MocA family oxidoreductase [Pseudomonadota bacterium]